MTRVPMMAAALTVLLAVMMSPASADQPTVVTINFPPFEDVNPCTGLLHTVNISLTRFIHDGHNNNFVVHVERTGFTDSGYTMFSGHLQLVDNAQVLISSFKDLWRNDDGSIFEAARTLIVNENQGEIQVDEGGLRCIHT